MDIENIKKVLSLVALLGNVAGQVMEDGKVSVDDAAQLVVLFAAMPKLADIEWSMLDDEALDISPIEIEQIKDLLVNEFDIPQDALEDQIEKYLEVAALIGETIVKIMELIR